jgi:hypothetical protein
MKNKVETNISLEGAPNEKYAKFFEKFKEIETLEVAKWNATHVLAYFCKKYEDQYQVKYSFKFNSSSPIKCFEVFQIKRLAMLLSSNPTILKEYIDWVYENKVVKAKRRLTSISFLTNEILVADYKNKVLLSGKRNLNVDRSSPLPAEYQSVFQEIGIFAQSYGDLAFLFQMEKTPELELAIQKLNEMGFDNSIIARIV